MKTSHIVVIGILIVIGAYFFQNKKAPSSTTPTETVGQNYPSPPDQLIKNEPSKPVAPAQAHGQPSTAADPTETDISAKPAGDPGVTRNAIVPRHFEDPEFQKKNRAIFEKQIRDEEIFLTRKLGLSETELVAYKEIKTSLRMNSSDMNRPEDYKAALAAMAQERDTALMELLGPERFQALKEYQQRNLKNLMINPPVGAKSK